MDSGDETTVTSLLKRWNNGDYEAADKVATRLYQELHRIASSYFRSERAGHTFQPTAVVNEALLRLLESNAVEWQNGAHFIGVAARIMRRILIDHARGRRSHKRGGGLIRLTLDEAADRLVDQKGTDVLAVDEALERLAAFDPLKARIVELRFFAGLTIAETACYLGIPTITVNRQFRRAKAWLHGELEEALFGR